MEVEEYLPKAMETLLNRDTARKSNRRLSSVDEAQ